MKMPAIGTVVMPSIYGLNRGYFRNRGRDIWRATVVGYASDGRSVWVIPVGKKARQAFNLALLRLAPDKHESTETGRHASV